MKLSDSIQFNWSWGMPTGESATKDSLKHQEPPTGGIDPCSFCHHMLPKLQEHYVFTGACILSDPAKFPLIAWQSKVNKEVGVLFHKFELDTILLPGYMSPETISKIKRKATYSLGSSSSLKQQQKHSLVVSLPSCPFFPHLAMQ
jgi:hypothetical protein